LNTEAKKEKSNKSFAQQETARVSTKSIESSMQTYLSFIPRHQVSNTIVSPYGNNRDLAKPKSRAPGLMSSIFIGKIYLTEVYHDLTSLVFRDISTHMGLSLEGSRPFAMIFFTSEFTSG